MAVTLRNLMKHDWFKHTIALVTDETGLDTMVTWPYIRQTAEIGSWLNGGEMIFVFHQADTAELQIELLKEGIQAKVSAFVFLCGSDFILEIPEDTIDFANRNHLAVFSMPYHVKLIDVTKEIAEEILHSENKERMIFDFLSDLLSDNLKDEEVLKKEGYECGIDMEKDYLAVSIETTFDYNSQDYHKIMTFRNSFTYMLKYLEQRAAACGCRFIWKKHAVSAVGFILFEDVRIKEELCGQMDEIFQKHFLYSEVSLYAGYSGIHRGIAETGDAVQESKNAMIFCKKSDGRKSSYHYHELGILRLLVNSNSREELQDYCSRIFGKLIQSDKINMTEYLLTVKTYLENNNNMTVTAKKLFIHRNTLISRINKIEELTGKKLSDADVKLEFLCAFKLLEFLTEDEV